MFLGFRCRSRIEKINGENLMRKELDRLSFEVRK
jgi:hypothetical protein